MVRVLVATEDALTELVLQRRGIWGASMEHDRYLVRDLPVPEAVDELERTLPERLRARIDSWRDAVDARVTFTRTARDRWIEAMLGVTRFVESAVDRESPRNPTAAPAGEGTPHAGLLG